MVDFTLLIDNTRLLWSDWLKAFTVNVEYQVALAVLVLPVFIRLWLRRRFWIRIGGRRPCVQSHLPKELDTHIASVKNSIKRWGNVAGFVWATSTFAICESFAIALSLSVSQQGIVLRDSSTVAYTALFARVTASYFALIATLAVWVTTLWLWMRAPLWIESKRNRWAELRKKCREMGCGYYDGREDWKGWAGWELEDEKLLNKRNVFLKQHIDYVESKERPTKKDMELLENRDMSAWEMLDGHSLEMSYWESLKDNRVPHIYQLGIQINHGNYRYLDFALLNPRTGEPVLGIETDEQRHFEENEENNPQDDFVRELHIMKAVGIPVYRIPGAYWLRGLPPKDIKHPEWFHRTVGPKNRKYPEEVKESQQRLLDDALRERDRIIKEKRKQARRRWLPRFLRRRR